MSIVSQILANPERYSIQELQQAMQSGVVPGYVAVPLIQDKVQQQQRMQMAMQAQGAPEENGPTVVEEVMQQATPDTGIEALQSNLPGEEQSYAPGGIVAFEDGGYVPRYRVGGLKLPKDYEDTFMPPSSELEEAEEGIASLARYADAAEGKRASKDAAASAVQRFKEILKEQGVGSGAEDRSALRQYLEEQSAGSEDRAKRAQAMNWIKMAGDVLGGQSRFGAVNLGTGVSKNIPDILAQEEAQRKEGLQNLMARSQLSAQERAEAMEAVTGGMGMYKTELEEDARVRAAQAKVRAAEIAALRERDTFGDRQVMRMANAVAQNDYGKPLAELPPDVQRTILGAASTDYQRTLQAAQFAGVQQRGTEAAGELGARLQALEESARNRATDAVTASLNNARSPEAKEWKRIYREQGPDAAANYKQTLINDYIRGKSSAPSPKGGAPAPAPAPKAAGSSKLSAVDQKALEWANANPQDPRAAQIKARLGIR